MSFVFIINTQMNNFHCYLISTQYTCITIVYVAEISYIFYKISDLIYVHHYIRNKHADKN